ncbi:BAH domain [Striga asiatica]|uniref:BAH domain n=1 Tax=Striga asiatica TaxID=4170 RepID=A0A5A7RGU7_STRAF|nr:BAH domain [Striga asiatica]
MHGPSHPPATTYTGTYRRRTHPTTDNRRLHCPADHLYQLHPLSLHTQTQIHTVPSPPDRHHPTPSTAIQPNPAPPFPDLSGDRNSIAAHGARQGPLRPPENLILSLTLLQSTPPSTSGGRNPAAHGETHRRRR